MFKAIIMFRTPYRTAILLRHTPLQNTVCFAKYTTWKFFIFSEEDKIEAVCEQVRISQQ